MAVVIERISALASAEDAPGTAVAFAREAAAGGDESWREWLEQLERGEALTARIRLTVELRDGARRHQVVGQELGAWLELGAHPPSLERQVADVAALGYWAVSQALRERGVEIDADELSAMFVHVELSEELRKLVARVRDRAHRAPGRSAPAL